METTNTKYRKAESFSLEVLFMLNLKIFFANKIIVRTDATETTKNNKKLEETISVSKIRFVIDHNIYDKGQVYSADSF
jgi:hypothetical protein